MKKLFLSIALLLSMTAAIKANEPVETVYVKVSWIDNIGSKSEISAECKKRQNIVKEMSSKGFQFNGLVTSPKGQCPGRYASFIRVQKDCK